MTETLCSLLGLNDYRSADRVGADDYAYCYSLLDELVEDSTELVELFDEFDS